LPNQDKPSGKQHAKREHDVHVRGTILTDLSPNEEKRHNAERKEDKTAHETERKEDRGSEGHKIWLERFTLLAVVIYAGITFWQGCLTRESIDNNSKQFQFDQRPYLGVLDYANRKEIVMETGKKMSVNFPLANYGKSPAVHAQLAGKIFIGPNAMQEADKWFESFAQGSGLYSGEIAIPPGIPDPQKYWTYSTSFSDGILTADELEYIAKQNSAAVVTLRIKYSDLAGNSYSSEVCLTTSVNNSLPHCEKHNELH
jgi:hypothetical protein